MQPPTCSCFDRTEKKWRAVHFHDEIQDTDCDAWKRLTDLVDEAAADGREEFAPFQQIRGEERARIVTLPPSVASLKSVKHFLLYGTHLVRIPREVGDMTSLERFTPYTSWRLHWLPYEITRCRNLIMSTISTRCLYGNYKHRPPFPALPVPSDQLARITDRNLRCGQKASVACSVCSKPCSEPVAQAWISLLVATDVAPLLVNACSQTCIDALPTPKEGYVQCPHAGGLSLEQPAAEW